MHNVAGAVRPNYAHLTALEKMQIGTPTFHINSLRASKGTENTVNPEPSRQQSAFDVVRIFMISTVYLIISRASNRGLVPLSRNSTNKFPNSLSAAEQSTPTAISDSDGDSGRIFHFAGSSRAANTEKMRNVEKHAENVKE